MRKSNWTTKPSECAGGDYEKAPAGTHVAVLVGLIDMGTQRNEFQGKVDIQHRAYFVFELPLEKDSNGNNHLAAIDLNMSLNEKAKLRGWIEAWRGKRLGEDEVFDFTKLLGKPCLLTISHTEKGHAKITGLAAPTKGMQVPAPSHKPLLWGLEDQLAAIPEWVPYCYGEPITERIKKALEFTDGDQGDAAEPAGATAGSTVDELGF